MQQTDHSNEEASAERKTTDIECAKELLYKRNFTCVLCRGDEVYTSIKPGISPMLDFLSAKTDLRGFSAADRVVGKAAAMLFVLAGVSEVYAHIISQQALDVFRQNEISFSYGTLTPGIVNRTGTGPCPMERAVASLRDPAQAYVALKDTLEFLKSHPQG